MHGLFNSAFSNLVHRCWWLDDKSVKIWQACGRKWSWSSLEYAIIYQEKMRKPLGWAANRRVNVRILWALMFVLGERLKKENKETAEIFHKASRKINLEVLISKVWMGYETKTRNKVCLTVFKKAFENVSKCVCHLQKQTWWGSWWNWEQNKLQKSLLLFISKSLSFPVVSKALIVMVCKIIILCFCLGVKYSVILCMNNVNYLYFKM